MSYWAAAQLQPQRDGLAIHCLRERGFETYAPRLRERRPVQGRLVERTPLLFPNYLFVRVELQWSSASYAPGVIRLVLNGAGPARVPDALIDGIRGRENGDGLIELPRQELQRGDRVRILRGPFQGRLGLYEGQPAHRRIAILLSLLGGQHRVTLPLADVGAVE